MNVCFICVRHQSVGSGLSLEPPATTEADEEEDGMSDIIQEVTDSVNAISCSIGLSVLQRWSFLTFIRYLERASNLYQDFAVTSIAWLLG